jgi:hypothetical protein
MIIILSLNLRDLVMIDFDFSIAFLQEIPKRVKPSHFQMWQGCGSIGKNRLACSCGLLQTVGPRPWLHGEGGWSGNLCTKILGIAWSGLSLVPCKVRRILLHRVLWAHKLLLSWSSCCTHILRYYVSMETLASAEDAGEGRDDLVITACGVIVKVYQGFSPGIGDIVFELFH